MSTVLKSEGKVGPRLSYPGRPDMVSAQHELGSPAWILLPQTPLGTSGGTAGDKRNLLEISTGSPILSQLPPPTNKEERVGKVPVET